MQKKKIRIYLASPYGFTDSGSKFMRTVMIPSIANKKFQILNPWNTSPILKMQLKKVTMMKDNRKQMKKFSELNLKIGLKNEELLDKSDMVIAILDGTDVDSGVASEVGYAYAKKKLIMGYRSDFRLSGDNSGTKVNLQVEYFIKKSGGQIITNIKDLEKSLKNYS